VIKLNILVVKKDEQVSGAKYLNAKKPHETGKSSHVANANYIKHVNLKKIMILFVSSKMTKQKMKSKKTT